MGGYGNPGMQNFMQSFQNADYIANADSEAAKQLSADLVNNACQECRESTCEHLKKQLARNKDEQEKAMLASASYCDPDAPLPEGYERATDQDLQALGLLDADGNSLLTLEGHPDFNAEAFVKNDGSYVIGFQGTNMKSVSDWGANFRQGLGLETAYYKQAETIGRLAGISQPDNVSFVGHSLGGGLASAASGASGLPAQTFNSAGLSNGTLSGLDYADQSLVNATYVVGDVLSGLQDRVPGMKEAFGIRRAVEPAEGVSSMPIVRNVKLHLMGYVHKALQEEQQKIELEMRQNRCV